MILGLMLKMRRAPPLDETNFAINQLTKINTIFDHALNQGRGYPDLSLGPFLRKLFAAIMVTANIRE